MKSSDGHRALYGERHTETLGAHRVLCGDRHIKSLDTHRALYGERHMESPGDSPEAMAHRLFAVLQDAQI